MASPQPTRAEREAGEWVVLLDAAVVPGAELERFRQWHAASEENRRAYAVAADLWEKSGPALASVPREKLIGAADPSASRRGGLGEWRRFASLAGAARKRPLMAGLAIAAAAALIMLAPLPDVSLLRPDAAYATAARESRVVRLPDQSSVELSPLADLVVAYSTQSRLVSLRQGIGYFHVAREARPFVVRTPHGEVRGQGLSFVVRIEGGETIVTVLDGVVVASPSRGPSLFAHLLAHPQGREVRAGHEVRLEHGDAQTQVVGPQQAQARLAWRERRVVLDDARLDDATLEVTRFSGVRFAFGDASLASLRVSGAFDGGDVTGFLAALRANFSVAAERRGDLVTLTRAVAR